MAVATAPIHTHVRYLAPEWRNATELPRIGDRDTRRKSTQMQNIEVFDARPILDELDLDVQGFKYFDLEPGRVDFKNKDEVKSMYFPQVRALAKRATGASEVFFAGHLVRTEDTSDFNTAYARFVHCDYGIHTARSRAEDVLKQNQKDVADYADADFIWMNSWQPFDHTVQRNPLCVIDSSSLAEGDLVDYLYTANKTEFKSSMPIWQENHRFYYVSNMRTDEVVLFKQLDTRKGVAKCSPHSSFDLPASNPDTPPRRSIETRFVCVLK